MFGATEIEGRDPLASFSLVHSHEQVTVETRQVTIGDDVEGRQRQTVAQVFDTLSIL